MFDTVAAQLRRRYWIEHGSRSMLPVYSATWSGHRGRIVETQGVDGVRQVLLTLNAVALLLLSGMSDLHVTTRLELAGVVVVNLLFVAGPSALTGRAARLGAAASLTGYVTAIVSWIVLALGCGIEYFNARC